MTFYFNWNELPLNVANQTMKEGQPKAIYLKDYKVPPHEYK